MSNITATTSAGPKASYEAVRAAADAISAEGATPSVRTVTARIGGGSPNTITAHLRKWRDERPAVEARKAIVIDERIAAIIGEQISSAVTEATKLATAERDARAEDLGVLEQRSSELERDLEASTTRVAELEDEMQRQAGRLEGLQGEMEHAKAEAAKTVQKARDDAAAAVAKADGEAAGERAKLDEMARQLGAAQEQAAEAIRLRQALAEMTTARETERTGRVEAEKALAVAEALGKEATLLADAAAKRAETLDGELVTLRSKMGTAEVAAGLVPGLTERTKVLDDQVGQLRDKLASAEVQAAKALAQAEERAAQISTLTGQLRKASERPQQPETK